MFSKLKTNEHKEGSQVLEDAEKMGCRSAGVLFWTSVFHVNNPFFSAVSQVGQLKYRLTLHRDDVLWTYPHIVPVFFLLSPFWFPAIPRSISAD